jgi:hypothetical protein
MRRARVGTKLFRHSQMRNLRQKSQIGVIAFDNVRMFHILLLSVTWIHLFTEIKQENRNLRDVLDDT